MTKRELAVEQARIESRISGAPIDYLTRQFMAYTKAQLVERREAYVAKGYIR